MCVYVAEHIDVGELGYLLRLHPNYNHLNALTRLTLNAVLNVTLLCFAKVFLFISSLSQN